MKNWKDADESNIVKWYEIWDITFTKPTIPADLACPECAEPTIHYFYLRWGEKNRGGSWIWCSSCLSFIHASGIVPDWWKNIEHISPDLLEPQPEWLEVNLIKWEPILLNNVKHQL